MRGLPIVWERAHVKRSLRVLVGGITSKAWPLTVLTSGLYLARVLLRGSRWWPTRFGRWHLPALLDVFSIAATDLTRQSSLQVPFFLISQERWPPLRVVRTGFFPG